MERISLAELIARACAQHGVDRVFGVPGGGSSLDLIEAFARCGIDFVLCRTETGAILAAAADAEIRNGFGVAIATQGPGAASAMNGLAHASLDRAPVLFISDGWTDGQLVRDTHQVFDQQAMSAPVVKATSRLESADPAVELSGAIAAMLTAPWGPAHIVLTGANAKREVTFDASLPGPEASAVCSGHGDIRLLLEAARRPVLLVGLEARERGAAAQIALIASALQCPVLSTYKAKGLVSDESPLHIGHVTGGAVESDVIGAADLIILCGFDPVELIGKPWPYQARVIDIALAPHPVHYVRPAAGMYGPLGPHLELLLPYCRASAWEASEIATLRADMRQRLAYVGTGEGVSPQRIVELALRQAKPERPAITVDAGAHMFSAMAFWQATAPAGALISNGLATMAYALPAGIARALHSPSAPTIAFTGDGGLMMCAGELATLAQTGARLCVVVFNDSALSLIALKQHSRGMAQAGVHFHAVDFASVARGFGILAFTARDETEFAHAVREALASNGPSLIDVRADPTGYRAQATALRG